MLLIYRKQNEAGLKLGALGLRINRVSFRMVIIFYNYCFLLFQQRTKILFNFFSRQQIIFTLSLCVWWICSMNEKTVLITSMIFFCKSNHSQKIQFKSLCQLIFLKINQSNPKKVKFSSHYRVVTVVMAAFSFKFVSHAYSFYFTFF